MKATTLYPFHGEKLTLYEISKRLGFVKQNGRAKDTFRKKVKRLGYAKALEMTEGKRRIDRDYVVFGEVSKPITEWCRIFGLHDTTVFSRLKMGWEIHAALTVPAAIKHVRRDDSLSEIARRHGLEMGTVWARRSVYGWGDTPSLNPINEAENIRARAEGHKTWRERNVRRKELMSLGIIAE